MLAVVERYLPVGLTNKSAREASLLNLKDVRGVVSAWARTRHRHGLDGKTPAMAGGIGKLKYLPKPIQRKALSWKQDKTDKTQPSTSIRFRIKDIRNVPEYHCRRLVRANDHLGIQLAVDNTGSPLLVLC